MTYTLIIDTETTGFPTMTNKRTYHDYTESEMYNTSRMLELGFIMYKDGKEIETFDKIVKVDFPIYNNDIHGITNNKSRDEGIDINDIFTLLYKTIKNKDVTIVAHNIKFDMNIILAEAYRNDHIALIEKLKQCNQICTCVLAREKLKLKYYIKLVNLYKKLFNKQIEQEHRALSDVRLCSDCYFKLIEL